MFCACLKGSWASCGPFRPGIRNLVIIRLSLVLIYNYIIPFFHMDPHGFSVIPGYVNGCLLLEEICYMGGNGFNN